MLDYVGDVPREGGDYDLMALKYQIFGELRSDANNVVITYTDWLGARIVRQGDYSVPAPNEIDKEAILPKVPYVRDKLLDRVIAFMHSQSELPLLGNVKNGCFEPNETEFELWKSYYDWNK